MPQMAPISWLSLFMLFFLIFMMFNIMNYFIFNPIMPKPNMNMKKNMYPLNWKW
uniref:ATP synthase F0 subunit 8 n=1 Tax=Ornithomya biloba TaxID=452742 RepID=UPI001F143A50|nr:ATP synthase F0 subunit 8 [Ornithomya biloba]UKS08895.1 ATP synthase F0 subunit 8 [Ornithomya biloba]